MRSRAASTSCRVTMWRGRVADARETIKRGWLHESTAPGKSLWSRVVRVAGLKSRPTVATPRNALAGERMASRTANGKAGERIVLVDETQADRPTIEAYELITRKLRVPRVPVFFRALAGEKALLPCWQALRPAVRLRAFEEGADELRARAVRGAVELGCPLIETQLEWAGYDVDEIDEIRGQVNIFHYQDAKILLAVAVLCEALTGTAGGGRETPRALQRVPRGVPHEMDIVELVPEEANGSLARVFRWIRTHLGLGIVGDDCRAFARWPKYLNIAWD